MRLLVACEESGIVTRAFRERGVEAWSCDILPSSDGKRSNHIQRDLISLFEQTRVIWDMVIAFPPCTHLCSSGARWFEEKRADGRQGEAMDFFMRIANYNCDKIAIENPIGIMSTQYRKPDQIIQPWQFGHGETKATCLWLKGLPKLTSTNIVEGREARIHKMAPSKDRSRLRSQTYQGIADAMADQWSQIYHNKEY